MQAQRPRHVKIDVVDSPPQDQRPTRSGFLTVGLNQGVQPGAAFQAVQCGARQLGNCQIGVQRSRETHRLRTGIVQHQLHVQLLGKQTDAQLQAEGVIPALACLGAIPQRQHQVGSMQAGHSFGRRHVGRHMGLGQPATSRRRGTGRHSARFGPGHARKRGGSRRGLGRHVRRDSVPGQLAGKAMARQGKVRPPLIELRKDHRHAAAHGFRFRRQTRGAVQALHAIGRHP